jgi:hypothetical protein
MWPIGIVGRGERIDRVQTNRRCGREYRETGMQNFLFRVIALP